MTPASWRPRQGCISSCDVTVEQLYPGVIGALFRNTVSFCRPKLLTLPDVFVI